MRCERASELCASASTASSLPPTHMLATHICVSSVSPQPSIAQLTGKLRMFEVFRTDRFADRKGQVDVSSCKIVFTPPLGQFSLAQYKYISPLYSSFAHSQSQKLRQLQHVAASSRVGNISDARVDTRCCTIACDASIRRTL